MARVSVLASGPASRVNLSYRFEQETEKKGASATDRFTARTEGAAEKLAKSTVGLVTLDEFRRTRDEIEEAQRMATAQKVSSDLAGANKKKKEKKKKEKAKLSFAVDGEDEEEEVVPKSSDKKRSNEDSDGMCNF
jgi:protein FAM50